MMRFWPCLLLLAAAQPALAGEKAGPYYGPMKRWHGIGYKFGYEDRVDGDGAWQIISATRSGDATAVAMYRAAERAREQGYDYVQFLGGRDIRSPGMDQAILSARPSHSPTPPAACPPKWAKSCYMASVAGVLRALGGPDGTQPGVQVADERDKFGREVFYPAYGSGALGLVGLRPVAPAAVTRVPTQVAAVPIVPGPVPVSGVARVSGQERFAAALKAAQPVRGRSSSQGWTISD